MMDDFQVADDFFTSISDLGFVEENDSLLIQNIDSISPVSSLRASGSSPASYPGTERTEVASTPELSRSYSNVNCLSTTSSFSSEKSYSNDDIKNFPALLHDVVSDEKNDSIHWLSCGTRFVLSDRNKFTKTVLSQFGGRGQAKFTSFTRRLKRWEFKRVPSGGEMGAYFREDFHRDRPEIANKIKYPISIKGKGKIAAAAKAQRRASTGSFLLKKTASVDAFEGKFFDISPTPIKCPLEVEGEADSLPFPVLENWLSSTDLFDEKKVTVGPAAPSAARCPLPRPPIQHQTLKQPIMVYPKATRRHSIALYNLSMQQTLSSADESISAGPRQLAHDSSRYLHGSIAKSTINAKSSRLPQPQQIMSMEMSQHPMQVREEESHPFGFN